MKKTASADALDRALANLYQADLPAGFQAAWREAVKREEPTPMQPRFDLSRLRRAALPVAAALVLIAGTLITGELRPAKETALLAQDTAQEQTESAVYSEAMMDTSYGYAPSANETYAAAPAPLPSTMISTMAKGTDEGSAGGAADDERKIVRTVSLTLNTTDFDRDYDAVLALAGEAGGYAASVSMYEQQADRRSASFALRIPAAALDDFLTNLDAVGHVSERYEATDDYTTQYSDTGLRLQTQQEKLARLQELMGQAGTVDELLQIESEIADTQYQIDSLESSLRGIDRQADYAAVTVYLRQQQPIDTAVTEDFTLGERIRYGLEATTAWLGRFFENMLVFLVAAAPVLVPLILLYIVIRVLRRRKTPSNKPKP